MAVTFEQQTFNARRLVQYSADKLFEIFGELERRLRGGEQSYGTWTPADASGADLVFTGVAGFWQKHGNQVIATCTLTYPATVDGSSTRLSGLPFTVANSQGNRGGVVSYSDETTLKYALPTANAQTIDMYLADGTRISNATMSGNLVYLTFFYRAA